MVYRLNFSHYARQSVQSDAHLCVCTNPVCPTHMLLAGGANTHKRHTTKTKDNYTRMGQNAWVKVLEYLMVTKAHRCIERDREREVDVLTMKARYISKSILLKPVTASSSSQPPKS